MWKEGGGGGGVGDRGGGGGWWWCRFPYQTSQHFSFLNLGTKFGEGIFSFGIGDAIT